MDRWTIKQLNETNDLLFAISILQERRSKVTPYSPLGCKLSNVIYKLNRLQQTKNATEALQIIDEMRINKKEMGK